MIGNNKKYTIEYCKKYAAQRGYEILDDSYVNAHTKIKMRHICDKCDNYTFEMDFNHFKNAGNRCPCCSGKVKLTIEYCQKIANKRGFEILTEAIENSRVELKIKHNNKSCDYFVTSMAWYQFQDGQGCKKCSRKLSPTTKDITDLATALGYVCHNPDIYENQKTLLTFTHLTCHSVFDKGWKSFSKEKGGCQTCKVTKTVETRIKNISKNENNLRNTNPELCEEWSSKNKETPDMFSFGSTRKKVYWICAMGHEDYPCTVNNRVKGKGCPVCANHKPSENNNFAVKFPELLKEWNYKINGNPYDYLPFSNKSVWWSCNNCKHKWKTNIANRTHNKRGCPVCDESKGESVIRKFLDRYFIINKNYFMQHKLDGCKSKRKLPFDFAIYKNNELQYLIEYNGKQHYKLISYFGGEKAFKEQKKRDKIKLKYCQDNNIPLLVIPYWEFDNIENILTEKLKL